MRNDKLKKRMNDGEKREKRGAKNKIALNAALLRAN